MALNDLTLDAALQAAVRAALAAADVINDAMERGSWTVRQKADASPVTEVDVAAEEAIRVVLTDGLPEAGFYGEETGQHDACASRQRQDAADVPGQPVLTWLVDPIDGTKSFVRGMRYFSTQIALEADGELLLGVSNAPAYAERLEAVRGRPVHLNGRRARCRPVTRLEDAFLSSGNLGSLAANSAAWQAYGCLVSRVQRVRGYGDFCHYHQLCCGQTDLIVESDVNILDIAALTVGIRSAGGLITDLDGAPVGRNTSSVLAAGTEELHRRAFELLHSF